MKITITIEVSGSGEPSVRVSTAKEKRQLEPPRTVEIATVPPPPIPAEPVPVVTKRPGAGPQFDPGFLAIVRDLPEPWTRRALAAASGESVTDVTLRISRMKHRGWVEQPSPGLWRKTRTFGQKPAPLETENLKLET